MNIQLLNEIRETIKAEPRRLRMHNWGMRGIDPDVDPTLPPCGTIGCIAGWAVFITEDKTGKVRDDNNTQWLGKKLLELSQGEACRLFFVDFWPVQFAEAYEEAPTGSVEAAEITDKRIQHFINTNGLE